MRILNSLYPYPVLSSGDEDYQNSSSFDVLYELIPATSFKKARLIVDFVLVDEGIQSLVDCGKAGLFLHVESPRAAYRTLYQVDGTRFELEIDPSFMRTLVEVTAFVLATQTIEGYRNKQVNPDFYGRFYQFPTLESGDPLAVSYTMEVELEEMDDFAKVSSIIKVAQTKDKLMKVDYDQDVIFVYLPENHYKSYVKYPNIFGEIMLTSIIQPALIYVLDSVSRNKGEGMQDRKWYQVLDKKIESLNYSMYQLFTAEVDSVLLAQAILQDPMERMFTELEDLVADE